MSAKINAVRGRPRSEASRLSILETAERLFGENGYAGTSLEAIAKGAGVGKQTIYRWWPTKSHLASDIYERLAPKDEIAPDTGALKSDISTMLRILFRAYAAGPAAALLSGLIVEAQGSGVAANNFRAGFFASRRSLTVALFNRARDRGEIPPNAEIDFLSDLLIGAIWLRLLSGHAPLDDGFAEKLARHLTEAAGQISTEQENEKSGSIAGS